MRKSRSRKDEVQNVGRTLGIVSAILIVAVVLGTVLPLTLGSSENTLPLPTRISLETLPGIDTQFQERICTCDNTWPFCSDERTLSNDLFAQNVSVVDPRGLSSLAVFWGQFIDHDIVLSSSNASDGLCSLQMLPNTQVLLNITRVETRRLENGCREPLNHQTPTIDASTVYGASAQQLSELRVSANSCLLRTSAGNLLPLSETNPMMFVAGDERNTEHAVLASLHTLWMREHNRLCGVLQVERPTWTEEQRFWKARQVVMAKIQFITYQEWLPTLYGSQASLLQTVPLRGSGVRMPAEFSVISFRFGHSMIPDPIGDFPLFTLFFNRTLLVENGVERFLDAAYTTAAQRMDDKVVDGLRNFLFMMPGMPMGEDLVTRNLFRSRELSMPTYTQMAQCYGFATQNSQQEAYIGLFKEPLEPGSSLPRGIAIIVAEFFKRLRQNDPLHYSKQHEELGSRFVTEVYRTTLGSVIRANTNVQNVPDDVFFL